ncbi:PilZ domain-containing protein [Azohydromonas caseinilytica]|uniref:PilZ domain-containing protein n=1 Tax=Azohydromonas caseinilytica TaxID=2728836 RepID=A0A848F6L4_9BURK|nr:PilZ domain-containing protein [Azohydromonas caseinilytica]NML15737.1 PilZ domain-containing protein [Azohydromonas caseinilytica]
MDKNMGMSIEAGILGHWDSADREVEKRTLRTRAMLVLSNREQLEGRTYFIASSGMGVVAPLNLPQGCKCEVHFRLPLMEHGSVPIRLHARVHHSILSAQQGGFLIGLDFTEAHADVLHAIKRYMTG